MAVSDGDGPPLRRSVPAIAVSLIAVAHVGSLLALPRAPSPMPVAALEAGLLVAVTLLLALDGASVRTLLGFAAVYAVAVGGSWLAVHAVESGLAAALGVVSAFALAGYGLHRYELASLGLVEVADE